MFPPTVKPSSEPPERQPPADESPPHERIEPPVFFYEVLAQGAREIFIYHNERVYRLRANRDGQLTLNQ